MNYLKENDYPSALDQDDQDDKKDIVSIKEEEENNSSVKELRVKDSLKTPNTNHLAKSKLYKKTLKKSGGLDKTTCDVCNFQCTSIEELKDHKLEHQDGKFKLCFYCDFKIEDWIRLRFHIDRKHPEHGEKKIFM